MPKPKQLPPSVEGFRETITRFTRQSNRGTALIAAAWIDDALKELLRVYFRPDKATIQRFLENGGPLGTFSSRIELAYLLDVIEPSVRRDLELVRKIRNDFAHSRNDLRFRDSPVRDRCRQLHAARACELGGWAMQSPGQKFFVTAYFLTQYIMSYTKPRKRNPICDYPDPSYGPWTRRMAKGFSLAKLSDALDALALDSNMHRKLKKRKRSAQRLSGRRLVRKFG